MLEAAPSQPHSHPDEYDPAQTSLQWMQQQLTEKGITVTPDKALNLFEQKIVHDAERWLQQDLAEHGIDVSPDEAFAIQKLRLIHLIMGHTGTTDPHEAIERMASYDPSKPYELDA